MTATNVGLGVAGTGIVAVTAFVVRLITETVLSPWLITYARVPSCSTPTMTGFFPTGTFATRVPKPTASIGLLVLQFGFEGLCDRGAQRNTEDTDAAVACTVTLVRNDQLRKRWSEIRPGRRNRLRIGNRSVGHTGIQLIVLRIDNGDGV